MRTYPCVLTIAGSDCSGGAGIQADIKAISALGAYAASAITAITVQNTLGVTGIHPVPPAYVKGQIEAVMDDIRPKAVKIGMINDAEIVKVIAESILKYHPEYVVFDPVMVSTSGHSLLAPDCVQAVMEYLIPRAGVITPNIPEAEVLSGMEITSKVEMVKAAEYISKKHCRNILIKGGHFAQDADDLLFSEGEIFWFAGKRIETKNTHGTGCTLSSAIASNLAKGDSLNKAVERAKGYITRAIESGLEIGHGNGPVDHSVSAD